MMIVLIPSLKGWDGSQGVMGAVLKGCSLVIEVINTRR